MRTKEQVREEYLAMGHREVQITASACSPCAACGDEVVAVTFGWTSSMTAHECLNCGTLAYTPEEFEKNAKGGNHVV